MSIRDDGIEAILFRCHDPDRAELVNPSVLAVNGLLMYDTSEIQASQANPWVQIDGGSSGKMVVPLNTRSTVHIGARLT